MRHTLLLLSILFFFNFANSQNSYSNLWLKVEAFEVEGLPKSALKIVKDIEKKAKKSNNQEQLIKTMLFKSKFHLILEEDAQLNIVNDFKNEIKKSETPSKNVLENILAHLYWDYFNQNKWQFYNRTKTSEKINTEDFRTWDLQTLFNEIHFLYQNSLQNIKQLQQEPLENYNALLNPQKNSKIYRPTLFDFLSHNALEFYKTNETHITRPFYRFELDNPKLLDNAKVFSSIKIESKDSTSLQLNALKIYQSLTLFHLQNNNTHALGHVDIERIKFVSNHASFKNKQDLELNALKHASSNLKNHEVSALYDFEIASIYYKQSVNYNPKTDEKYRWKAKEAMTLCNRVIDTFPKSNGAEKCEVLKKQIEDSLLQIHSEHILPIQKKSRLLVKYKNIDTLLFNVYNLTEKQFEKFENLHRKDQQLTFIKELKASKTWSNNLRNEHDYQVHTTEIVIPELNNGRYLIVATTTKNKDIFAYRDILITNMALVETETPQHKIFQVINRNNGVPITNAQVEVSYLPYNAKSMETKKYTTNYLGEFKIEKTNTWYRNVSLTVLKNKETAYFNGYYVSKFYKQHDNSLETKYRAFLFSDRSIYRPGQTVYFKAIAMKIANEKSEVLINQNITISLYNVNNEKISTLNLKTNDYGSVSGEFILPNNTLTGRFYIKIENNSNLTESLYFSVEEYKRPKFETSFNPITKTFRVNDSITVQGKAIAFSGSNITNAKVIYRVHRKVVFPHWHYWHRPNYIGTSQEITHGETTTDASGNFKILFKALPDQSIDQTTLPIFKYEITADVTDINGETHSKTTIVNVGYHALTAKINIDNQLNKTEKNHTINIDTKNLNEEFYPAAGVLKIYKLNAPNSVLRKRPWAAPDYQELSEKEFKSLFPFDAYTNEDDPNHWEKGKLVLEKEFNTKNSKTITLKDIKNWESGQYIVTLESKDKFGQWVKDEVKTTLFSPTDKTLADSQLFNITTNKPSYNIGETAYVTFGSSAKNVSVTVSIEKDSKIIETKIVSLNNNKKTISIPITKNDVGGFVVHYHFAFANSYISENQTIYVPYPKTHLEIETLTFRDKLQPGSQETWEFKIKGAHGEKVSSEILASMYDASLDTFKPHHWSFNPINKPTYYSRNHSKAYHSFGLKNFKVYNTNYTPYYPKQYYDQLNWFGFSMNNKNQYQRYLNSLRSKTASKFSKSVKKGFVIGTVYDETGAPIPAVNILVKNTSRGTMANFDGNFSIEASKNDILEISYIGYDTQEIKIGNKNLFHIYLTQNSSHLNEVVVLAYGSTKRSQITGSMTKVVNSDLEEMATPETDKILAGKTTGVSLQDTDEENIIATEKNTNNFSNVQIRKNLQETAFFFPQLKTDKEGHVSFSFTTPEALTQWKLQLLAHTKSLESSTKSFTTVTQKELMVVPNAPRFLREGDQITISSKIANLSNKSLSGDAFLILTDALTGNNINIALGNYLSNKPFSVDANNNTQVSWTINIPENVQAVQYKVIAKSTDFSDGEQNTLPVLSNRMLVTETLPMWIKSNESKTFTLDKLKDNTSTTLKNHKLTLEITSNPSWYAIQALPYLMEYPYECNEQTFSRYYANALANHIVNSNPQIQEVFNQWKSQNTLVSNLEKNEELKSILIQETPWLRDAQSETEQKKRIALLFDLNKMNTELNAAIKKLEANQLHSGAWSWFNGGHENRYITQHIITGFGHLKQLKINTKVDPKIINKAIKYLDSQFVEEYKNLTKYNENIDLTKDHLSTTQLHYLYMRSFFPEIKKSKEVTNIITYYQTQIKNYWLKKPLYSKGLMALVSHRNNDTETTSRILNSLKETSITSEELGMYWKENTNSWFWYQAPIETQALLIEVFSEIEKDTETVDNLKIWLLKNKQTNRWQTTKATTEAVYALLLQGSDWLSVTDMVDASIGNQKIAPSKLENTTIEAGTGYFKTSWNSSEIKPEMSKVTLAKKGNGIAWGGLYWQYFEDLDKITSTKTPLSLKKKLFLKSNTDLGEEITEITEKTKLKIGDLIRVRIELQSDRNMEFIHMKDMRASGLEPVNVISKYKWQDGLGYYESTKDASTNFFFDYLPKGVHIFEYDLRINNAGNMSNGITTVQSMYAPEFSSHSEGVRIQIK